MICVLLAIVGGLILLVNMGPGGLSVDEKKKTYWEDRTIEIDSGLMIAYEGIDS
jgi:hypothetical protein